MSATMKYKGYLGTVELDAEQNLLYGTVCGIKDVIHYEAQNAADLQRAFRESVDDYLAYCAERGEEPDKAYSGVLNVRFGPELHRRMAAMSQATDSSINDLIVQAVEDRYAKVLARTDDDKPRQVAKRTRSRSKNLTAKVTSKHSRGSGNRKQTSR